MVKHSNMSNRFNTGCFNCGDRSHFARNCPIPRQRIQMFQSQGTVNNRDVPTTISGDQTVPLKVGGVTKKSRRAGGHSTYLKAIIGNNSCDCLLDTGSEATIIPANLVDRSSVLKTTHTLKAANGTPIPLMGEIVIPIYVGGVRTVVTGLVSEHIAEVMLGIDWLTENKVVWEFGQSIIRIANRIFNLKTQNGDGQWCRKVTLQESVIIPAKSEMNLPARVICRPWKEDMTDTYWGTEPTTIVKGVHVSGTIIPVDRLYNIPVRVVNVTAKSIHLAAGISIANLHPITIVEDLESAVKFVNRVRAVRQGDENLPTFVEKIT